MRCSADSAYSLINNYVNTLNSQIESIQKNFNDMDFENVDARNETESIIKNMKAKCASLINELKSYRFS
jgi:hypothetical protein